MPFWKGDRAGRPLELGLAIGRLMHDLLRLPPAAAIDRLTRDHDLDRARRREPAAVPARSDGGRRAPCPTPRTIVVERVRDELGDWRVCVLSPRGGRIHAPWAMAAAAKIREETGIDVETLWGDDGFVVRFPDVDEPPDPRLLLPDPDEVQALVVRQLGATALFAAKFRENAARSLLLPKRRPGMRAPLWQQRKRAADLLAVASRYGSFPVLLETYRECLRDFFDMPALVATLADVRSRNDPRRRRSIRRSRRRLPRRCSSATSPAFCTTATRRWPSAARRRWPSIRAQLRELLGDAELRELLDAESMDAVERQLQRLDPRYRAQERRRACTTCCWRSATSPTDELRGACDRRGRRRRDRRAGRGAARAAGAHRRRAAVHRGRGRGALPRRARRAAAARHSRIAARSRRADPLGNLALRYARTHAPFTAADVASRYGLGRAGRRSAC